MSALSTRLVRLLNMVPYFQANPRITRAEAAAELGVTAKQLEEDLNQLWMCGLPGYSPGDLIDFEFCGDTIEVTFSAGIDRPLKLTSPEATGLLVALRALADIPGVVDPQAARSAIAKIAAAAGAVAAVAEQAPTESPAAAAVRAAVRNSRALTIDYYAASHDTLTTRIVDPIRVLLIGGHSYLEAWSREAEGVRLFRFDRIVDAAELGEPAVPPESARQAPPDTSLFDGDLSLPSATLRVAPSASWMLEYYPIRELRQLPDGSCEVAMTYASEDWMTRLLLGFGSDVRVLAPESLAQRVRDAATRWMHTRQLRRRDGAKSPGAAAAAVASGQRLEVIKVGSLSPWHWAILAVVVIVLFGAKKLPDAARSLGKSLRIFKSEVRELQNENKAEASIETPTPVQSQRVDPSAASGQDSTEARPA